MKFLKPIRNQKSLNPSVVCIDPAVLSSLTDTPATLSTSYQKGENPRNIIRRYVEKQHHSDPSKGIGLFIVTETENFFWDTVNESDNFFLSLSRLVELIDTYISEYYAPVVMIETPIPQNPKLNMTAGAIAGAIYSAFGAKPIWCNPINWKGEENQYFSRFLKRFGIDMSAGEVKKEFTAHEVDATLMYAYVFEGMRVWKSTEDGNEGV